MKRIAVMMVVLCSACSHVSVNKAQTASVKDDAAEIAEKEVVTETARNCNEDFILRGSEKCRKAYAAYATLARN